MPGRSSRSGGCRSPGVRRRRSSRRALAALAAEVVPAELGALGGRHARATPQDERAATLVRPFRREDGRLDWSRGARRTSTARSAPSSPGPGHGRRVDGRRLHMRRAHPLPGFDNVPIGALLPGDPVRVACGRGALGLELVQPEGRAPMDAVAWRNGLQRQHVLLGRRLSARTPGRPRSGPRIYSGHPLGGGEPNHDLRPDLHRLRPPADARHHRLGGMARAGDVREVGEGRLRHQPQRLRLRPPPARPAGPDRRQASSRPRAS